MTGSQLSQIVVFLVYALSPASAFSAAAFAGGAAAAAALAGFRAGSGSPGFIAARSASVGRGRRRGWAFFFFVCHLHPLFRI